MSVRRAMTAGYLLVLAVALGLTIVGSWVALRTNLLGYTHLLSALAQQSHPPVPPGFVKQEIRSLDRFEQSALAAVFVAGTVALVVGLALAGMLARSFAEPLVALSRLADVVRRGAEDVRFEPRGPREIQQAVQAFNEMAQGLQIAERQRQAQLDELAHEIRTPLTSLLGYCDGLASGAFAPDEVAHWMTQEIQMLRRLAEHLPDLGHMARRLYVLEPTSAKVLLTSLCATYAQLCAKRRIHWDHQPIEDTLYDVDANAVREALHNLLTNAIRHTPPGGHIRLTNPLGPTGYGRLVVEDSGPGVPYQDRDRLFRPHVRSGRGGTTGIGLTVVQAIAKAHGGQVMVDVSPLGGAAFVLTIPLAEGTELSPTKETDEN